MKVLANPSKILVDSQNRALVSDEQRIFSFLTESSNEIRYITLRLTNSTQATINWGDGTTEVITGDNTEIEYNHTYTNAGVYDVDIEVDPLQVLTFALIRGQKTIGSIDQKMSEFVNIRRFTLINTGGLEGDISYITNFSQIEILQINRPIATSTTASRALSIDFGTNFTIPSTCTYFSVNNLDVSSGSVILPDSSNTTLEYLELRGLDVSINETNWSIPANLISLHLEKSNNNVTVTNLVFPISLTTFRVRGFTGSFATNSPFNLNDFRCITNVDMDGNPDISGWNAVFGVAFYLSGIFDQTDASGWDFSGNQFLLIAGTKMSFNISQIFALNSYSIFDNENVTGSLLSYTPVSSASRLLMQNCSISDTFGVYDNIWSSRTSYRNDRNKTIDTSGNLDTVTGIVQGDLGTYTGDYDDLTETEIDNLVAGDDFDGNGTNIPWTTGNKIFALVNMTISSSDPTPRYAWTITV